MDASGFDRLTRRLAGRTTRRAALGTALAGLAAGALPDDLTAQDATPAATPADGEEPAYLFVQTFAGGRGEANAAAGTPTADGTPVPGGGAPFLLTLEGHTGQTIYFSDRPAREVGAVPTDAFLGGLGFSPVNPPNAALVAEFDAGQGVVVLQLIDPVYDADAGTLTYGAEGMGSYFGGLEPVAREQVEARLPAEFGPAALFIDDCPLFTTCSVEVWASFGGDPVYLGLEAIGPIPNGPYKACFDKTDPICRPCDTSLEKLEELCNAAYEFCMGGCKAT